MRINVTNTEALTLEDTTGLVQDGEHAETQMLIEEKKWSIYFI